jgi:hypothetical protein
MSRIGQGMMPLDTKIIPHVLRPKLGVPNHVDRWRAYGSVTNKGLYICGVWSAPSFSEVTYRVGYYFGRTWTAVRVARECGWILPLKANTPPGVVADYLLEEGQEDTNLYRLLMWFHWLNK